MQTLKAYLYPVIVEVQIPDPTIFTVRKRTVYTEPIKVYQGVDNPIQLLMLNQDNKPANLVGYDVIVDIQDPVNKSKVISYTVNFTDVTRKRGTIVIERAVVDALDQRFYKIAVKKVNEDTAEAVYSDANYNVLLDMEVLPAYYD